MVNDNTPLRESNLQKAKTEAKPDAFKSDGEQAKAAADTVASYLPGQSKPRDSLNHNAHDVTGNGRPGQNLSRDMKPTSEQGITGQIGSSLNQAASYVVPNDQKTTTENTKDTVTPGNDSSIKTGAQNIADSVMNAAVGAKNVVSDTVFGTGAGAGTGTGTGGQRVGGAGVQHDATVQK